MIVFDLTGSEAHPVYEALVVDNGNRQYDFLRSIVSAAVELKRPWMSSAILYALNYHAIACLHSYAGQYRPCQVTVGPHIPPEHYRVPALMEDFINEVNHFWNKADAVALAAFVLWRLNYIHPFVNGNGRTARAACYFVLCVQLGGWLKGDRILPEALRHEHHGEYIAAIRAADESLKAGPVDLSALHNLLTRLLAEQLGVDPPIATPSTSPPPVT